MRYGDLAPGRRRASLPESLALFGLLLLLWVALSDHYDAKMLLIGAACCALVAALTPDRVLQVRPFDAEAGVPLRRLRPLALAGYALWLLREIVLANIDVAKLVLHPRMPVDPRLLRFRVGTSGKVAQVVLAHSITLTPGTVTIDLEEGEYLVHALVPGSAEAVASGAMPARVAAAFGETPEGPPEMTWLHSVHDTGQIWGGPDVPAGERVHLTDAPEDAGDA